MKLFRKILCGILTVGTIGCLFVLPNIALSFADAKNTTADQQTLSPITVDLPVNLPLFEKARLASFPKSTQRTPFAHIAYEEQQWPVYQAAEEFYNTLVTAIGWEQIDFGDCGRNATPYLYLDTYSGKSAAFWDVMVAVEDSVYLQLIVDDQGFDVLSVGLLITDTADMHMVTSNISSFGNCLMDEFRKKLGGEWTCIRTDSAETDGDSVPGAALYELKTDAGGSSYSFYLEYKQNELHFGDIRFGNMHF